MTTELEFEPTRFIYLDLFPALVTRNSDDDPLLITECRLIVTNDFIYAILQDGIGQPFFALKEELVQFNDYEKGEYLIEGAHHDYTVRRDGNCGCGTRLRGMRFLVGKPHASRMPKK